MGRGVMHTPLKVTLMVLGAGAVLLFAGKN